MGTISNIENALNGRLAELSNSPPVSWPNMKYIPVEGRTFLRPTVIPGTANLESFSGSESHKGIYQIDIFCPLEKGVYESNNWIDSIRSLFKNSRRITVGTDVVFILNITIGPSQREQEWLHSIVEVHYQCNS